MRPQFFGMMWHIEIVEEQQEFPLMHPASRLARAKSQFLRVRQMLPAKSS
ncbi:hypothetical protein HZZ13_13595 [Bradyrhizobium sp. CNPSo 4010]|uniref:Transposase n=1 Tax=Bradyrhizobium agreste TaxID=2751811 RepID=A0ABS0PPB4_9BRAD|nr:hypothetical protein [Bradyrhizobium agreste]